MHTHTYAHVTHMHNKRTHIHVYVYMFNYNVTVSVVRFAKHHCARQEHTLTGRYIAETMTVCKHISKEVVLYEK